MIVTFLLFVMTHLDQELWVESIRLPTLSRKRLGGGEEEEDKEEH